MRREIRGLTRWCLLMVCKGLLEIIREKKVLTEARSKSSSTQ
jgi:hypothetical protein